MSDVKMRKKREADANLSSLSTENAASEVSGLNEAEALSGASSPTKGWVRLLAVLLAGGHGLVLA